MNFPNNVKYTEEHEWIRVEGDIAYVGISDYAQEQLGDIVFVDITTEGETLEKGEVFGTIEVVKNKTKHWLTTPNWSTKIPMAKVGWLKSILTMQMTSMI